MLPGWASVSTYAFTKDTANTAISINIKNKTYYLIAGTTEPVTLKTTNVTNYSKVAMDTEGRKKWARLYKRLQDATTISLVVTE